MAMSMDPNVGKARCAENKASRCAENIRFQAHGHAGIPRSYETTCPLVPRARRLVVPRTRRLGPDVEKARRGGWTPMSTAMSLDPHVARCAEDKASRTRC